MAVEGNVPRAPEQWKEDVSPRAIDIAWLNSIYIQMSDTDVDEFQKDMQP